MKRRTLDIAFSGGGLVLAAALVVLAVVFARDASFARSYVADQLGEQKITFKPADQLTDEEKRSECVVANAGQPLTTGKQAECYANDFIGLHLQAMGDGLTFAELGTPQREASAKVEAARTSNDPALAGLEKELADITATRDTKFKGETLRGLLLTSYGFSIFGEKAAQVGIVLFVIAGVLALLSIAGVVHAFATPKDAVVRLASVFGNGTPPVVAEPAPVARPKVRPRSAAPKSKATASRTKR